MKMMNMKMTSIACLILIATLTIVIVSAGCVGNQTTDDSETDVTASIAVEKIGSTYSIGDTIEIIFIGTSDVFPLYLKDHDDGISIEEMETSVKLGDKEVNGVKFIITALKEGDYTFSIGVRGSVDMLGLDDVAYKDTIHVENTGAEPMTPRGVFTTTNIAGHLPYPGDYYDVSIRGSATTGYEWVAQDTRGLLISEPVYIPDETAGGLTDGGGTYHWYITSETLGDYEFTAYNMPPGKDEPEGCVIIPMAFAKRPETADVSDVAASIVVEKNGVTYSIGDTMEVNLSVLSQGRLYVKECEDGISVDMKEVSIKHGDKDVTYTRFIVTALKNGNYSFSIGIDYPDLIKYGLDDVMYKDTLHIVDTRDEPMTPRGVFTWTRIADRPTFSGEYYEISIRGNAMTGYEWVAQSTPDLIISEPIYIQDENPEGLDGREGTYHWYVTSEIPGEYEFTAYNVLPGKDKPEGRIIIPIEFASRIN